MLTGSLVLLCLVFAYKLKRERELLAESIDNYSSLVASLNQKLQQQKQLAMELAHDLKSPLAGIVASVETLQLLEQDAANQYAECFKLMRDSGRTNLRLVSNFIEFVADRNHKVISRAQTIPDKRKDLLSGLMSSEKLSDNGLEWEAKVQSACVNLAIKPFACAFAELCDLAVAEATKHKQKARVTEELFAADKKLLLTLSPMPSGLSGEPKAHYNLAMKVLERLGVSITEAEFAEQAGFLEISLPLEQFALPEEHSSQKLAEAELLLSWSTQQVHSAILSVDSLKSVNEKESSDNESQLVELH